MSTQALYRVAAAALVVSGVTLALGLILHPAPPYAPTVTTARWAASHSLWWIGSFAAMVGLVGLYLRWRGDVGLLGFLGTALAVLGLAVIASAMYFEAFIAPSVAGRAPETFASYPAGGGWEGFLAGVVASGALFGLGFLLLAIQVYRIDAVPRWAVVLAVLGGLPFAVNFLLPRFAAVLAVVVFGVGLLGLGRALWRRPASVV